MKSPAFEEFRGNAAPQKTGRPKILRPVWGFHCRGGTGMVVNAKAGCRVGGDGPWRRPAEPQARMPWRGRRLLRGAQRCQRRGAAQSGGVAAWSGGVAARSGLGEAGEEPKGAPASAWSPCARRVLRDLLLRLAAQRTELAATAPDEAAHSQVRWCSPLAAAPRGLPPATRRLSHACRSRERPLSPTRSLALHPVWPASRPDQWPNEANTASLQEKVDGIAALGSDRGFLFGGPGSRPALLRARPAPTAAVACCNGIGRQDWLWLVL